MTLLRDLSMSDIVSRIGAVMLFAWLHGVLLAGLARLLGDRRPEFDGRLSANPFVQLSPWGLAVGVLFAMGWARPLRYEAARNRLGRWGVVAVVLGGLALTALLVPAADLLRPLALLLPQSGAYVVLYVIGQFQLVAAGSVLLNLLPVPGLTAGGIWQAVWPEQGRRLPRYQALGLAAVTAAVVAGLVPALGSMALPYLSFIGKA